MHRPRIVHIIGVAALMATGGLLRVEGALAIHESTSGAGELAARARQQAVIPGVPVKVRGPYGSSLDVIGRRGEPRRLVAADHEPLPSTAVDCTISSACQPSHPGISALERRESPLVLQWDASELYALDPQIAASRTHIIVTTTSEIGFYEKNGTRLSGKRNAQGNVLPFANPVAALAFFEPLIDPMNDDLHLQPEVALRRGPDGTLLYGIDEVYDLRVIFDAYRRRFWIAGLARNHRADTDDLTTRIYRRTKLVMAVSRTEDPRDGFHFYFMDAQPDDGQCWNPCGCSGTDNLPGAAADYPSIGITEQLVLLTVSGGQDGDLTPACTTAEQRARYAVLLGLDANDLASGVEPDGFRFHRLFTPTPDEDHPAVKIRPVHHHTPTASNTSDEANGYFVNFHHADSGHLLVIWGVDFTPNSGQAFLKRTQVPIATLGERIIVPQRPSPPGIPFPSRVVIGQGPTVMRAVYRDGLLYVTGSDCRQWEGASDCVAAIRLLRVNLRPFPFVVPATVASGFIDRTFGQRNVFDDGPDDIVHYGWPWIEVNREGTVVVAYNRSGETVFPEARFSARFADEADLRPSFLLHRGEYALGLQTIFGSTPVGKIDNSGMSVDPFDDTAVWMVQPYAFRPNPNVARGGYRLAVGKAFGRLHPDLVIPNLQLGANVVRQGGRLGLDVVVRNQGDGTTTGASLRITLSLDQFPSSTDVVAAQANVPAIEAGHEVTIPVVTAIDASPGRYYVIAAARDVESGSEYSTTNNFWPARESTRLQVFR